MSDAKPLGGKILTRTFWVCLILVVIAVAILIKRFIFGLGAVSNLSDGYPWGIWIAYDVVVGTALACGGYSMALLVYVANRGEYHPLVRPALLGSVFGYTMAGISVIFDLGRYWQMYNIFLPWFSNYHSVMFEVAICIGSYILVLWIELAPAFLEQLGFKKLKERLNRVLFVFVALGILLPTMHQSSLGTMILMAGHKLSPLWWSGFLPLLFLITSISMGYGVVILESSLSAVGFKRPLESDMLARISRIIPWLLGAYLVVRFEDVNLRGHMALVFSGGLESNMFLLENGLFLLAFLILVYPANRKNPQLVFIAAVSLLLGGALYRLNAYIIAFDPGSGWSYFPSVSELLVTIGIIAAEVMGYLVMVKKFPVLPRLEHV